MTPATVPRRAPPARAAAVGRNGGPDAVLEVFRRLGSIQFDPLSVAGRNHDLVLHARVAGYDPAWCEELLYGRRELFEAYNKGLSLLPTPELPWYRVPWRLRRTAVRTGPRRARRPRRGGARADPRRRAAVDAGLRARADGRLVLGADERRACRARGVRRERRLGLARREGNRRVLRPTERLFPAELLACQRPLREQAGTNSSRAIRAHGLLGKKRIRRALARARATRSGTRTVRTIRPARSFATNLSTRASWSRSRWRVSAASASCSGRSSACSGGRPRPPPSVSFLAPLDPFVWDRELCAQLFDFDYVWEVYVPEAKRQVGLLRAADALRRPARRPDRATDRPRRRCRPGARAVVGGRLRPAPSGWLRRSDARGAAGISRLRKREAGFSGQRSSAKRSGSCLRDSAPMPPTRIELVHAV